MTTERCTLFGGPANGCFLGVDPEADQASCYLTPVAGPIQRLVYRRVDRTRFEFVRAEPYTREPASPPVVVAHATGKRPPPEMKDWDRRAPPSV